MHSELLVFYPEGHHLHHSPGHPERPERVEAIRSTLLDAGWWDKFVLTGPNQMQEEILYSVHSNVYLSLLQQACASEQWLDADTYTRRDSYDLAIQAAGGAIAVVDAVWDRDFERGFALLRPPGHHATHDRGMGFCLLNNIALAAEFLVNSKQARKIAIVDLDLHHGNGTQDIFWERDDVFFISLHQDPLYPMSGKLNEIGIGKGKNFSLNVPFPPGTGDEAYLTAMQEIIEPVLTHFQPDMILVSFGFDIHWLDPLGNIEVSADTCKKMMDRLVLLANQCSNGRIVVVLEGGYDLDAASACSMAVVSSLTGFAWEDQVGPSPRSGLTQNWQAVLKKTKNIWDIN